MAIIRNPIDWSFNQLQNFAKYTSSIAQTLTARENETATVLPAVNRIQLTDLRDALLKGYEDFRASRSDIMTLAVVYPTAGLLVWWLAAQYDFLPLIVPLLTGFALLGPVAAVGFYEISLQREAGREITWLTAFDVVKSPAFGSIAVLGLALLMIFLIWLGVAQKIYEAFLGAEPPKTLADLFHEVFLTGPGRTMALVGTGVGFLFAAAVLAMSAVSFPMLLDRNVGPGIAVITSVRCVCKNPIEMSIWGLIVANVPICGLGSHAHRLARRCAGTWSCFVASLP